MKFDQINLTKNLEPQKYKSSLRNIFKNKNELFYFEMKLIRCFEKKLLDLFVKNLLFGTTHTCIGQECNSVSFLNAIETNIDIIWSNHRCHGHFISYSGNIIGLMAEIMGKKTGVCGGRGGSQHLHYKNFYSNGILGGTVPQALGSAFAIKNKKSICIVFIGDGTMGSGVFYESLNLASLWNCPIIFVCENNNIAQTTPLNLALSGSILSRVKAFDIKTYKNNSLDVMQIYDLANEVISYVRKTRKPAFVELKSIRLGPHSKGDETRSVNEIKKLNNNDPLKKIQKGISIYKDIDTICEQQIENVFQLVKNFEDAN
jgi:TPP-dependent pyruvate/acetoin dehydrogenase alpha subunit